MKIRLIDTKNNEVSFFHSSFKPIKQQLSQSQQQPQQFHNDSKKKSQTRKSMTAIAEQNITEQWTGILCRL